MDFRILGPLEVHTTDGPLTLGGTKQRAVLALLLLHPNEVVSSDRLIEEIWGHRSPATAATALQGYVSGLRKLLEPRRARGARASVLVTRPPGYELHVNPDDFDVMRFQRLRNEAASAAASGDVAEARALLGDALALWRGGPLADLCYEPFAQSAIARLEEAHLQALEERIDADIALGRHAAVVGDLEALVEEQPLRERLRRQLMLCLYRSDRQAEALEAYAAARRALVELGIEPGRTMRDLHGAMLRQDPALDLTTAHAQEAAPARDPFVGRQSELAALLAGLDDASVGRGRLFLVGGEPGIGKTRLADELTGRARSRGALVLVGRCWESGAAPAYWPWIQLLRAYVRDSDPAVLRADLGREGPDLVPLLPELRHYVPELPEPGSLESDGARFRLLDGTVQLLRRVARRQLLVLVLDDLHAADPPSLLLLEFLARELSTSRVLVVGAFREVDPPLSEPLADLLGVLAREPATQRLSLTGLTEAAIADYLALTGSDVSASQLAARLYADTEGNPLFVGEIVRLLAVERPEFTDGARFAIPQSLRDVIGRRLTHLSAECNRVLLLASVLGREFAVATLARLAGETEDAMLDALDEALAAHVVSDVPGATGRLRFAHVLIRDTLYERLGSPRRAVVHRRAVEALRELHVDDPGPQLAELAHHALAAHDFVLGLEYAWRAADRASAELAYEESARLYATALDALGHKPDDVSRCELLLRLGDAQARAGLSTSARQAFLEAAAAARRLGDPRALARAAAGYAGRIVWLRAGDDDCVVPLLEEGIAGLSADDIDLRVRLLARLAGALRDEPSRDRRDALSLEAVELARSSGDMGSLAEALDARAMAIVAPDTTVECLAIGGELRDVAERSGDAERVVAGHAVRIIAMAQVGDLHGVEADLAAELRIAEELRQPGPLWEAVSTTAMLALATGRFDEAEALSARALTLGEHVVPTAAIPVYRLQQYALGDFRGRGLAELEPAIGQLAAAYPARAVFRCVLAHLYARLERPTEAGLLLADLAEEGAVPFDQEWLYAMSMLAETAAVLAAGDVAQLLYDRLAPWATFNVADVGEGIRGSVARYLGLLATTTARWDAADAHFAEAVAMNARMGARPWLAHARHDHARMLLARGDAADRERALELVEQALREYRELGMESWATRAFALAASLRA